jgi:hypothetical protein
LAKMKRKRKKLVDIIETKTHRAAQTTQEEIQRRRKEKVTRGRQRKTGQNKRNRHCFNHYSDFFGGGDLDFGYLVVCREREWDRNKWTTLRLPKKKRCNRKNMIVCHESREARGKNWCDGYIVSRRRQRHEGLVKVEKRCLAGLERRLYAICAPKKKGTGYGLAKKVVG